MRIECPECGHEFDQALARPAVTWAVVLQRVRMGNGRFKSVVIASGVSAAEAKSIACEYRATGHKVEILRDAEVNAKAWRVKP